MTTNEFLPAGNAIGFATEFYTLWNVHPADDNGIQKAYFIKNISKDRDTAFAAHPDLKFYECLQGSFIEFRQAQPEHPDGTFKFGKYAGQPIADCTDYEYLFWYLDASHDDPHADARLQATTAEHGRHRRVGESGLIFWLTDAGLAEWERHEKKQQWLASGEITVEFASNVRQETHTIRIKNPFADDPDDWKTFIELHVPTEWVDMIGWRFYNGHAYGIVSGFGRSMKGKTATVKVSETDYGYQITESTL